MNRAGQAPGRVKHMKRMTIVTQTKNGGKSLSCNVEEWDNNCADANFENKCMRCNHNSRIHWRVSEYEATGLSPEEVTAQLAELAAYREAEAQGRFIELPYTIGSTMYKLAWNPYVKKYDVVGHSMSISDYGGFKNGIYYSTHDEALTALERMGTE